tara:strand:- start:1065 stop:1298 length:234 start_codon:yes stop_codon:yes gene_type:complete
MEESDQIGAVKVLVNAANIAQQRGAYSLEEAFMVYRAVKTLTTPPEDRAQKYARDAAAAAMAETSSAQAAETAESAE